MELWIEGTIDQAAAVASSGLAAAVAEMIECLNSHCVYVQRPVGFVSV